ncbi:hypothetical protein [Streptomyces sp. NPDC006971]|uniref:hypothetical protein n=1 Tax=Streptomyces sp. NPDC006971 TaxID=3154784 RepID=UPI0033D9301E
MSARDAITGLVERLNAEAGGSRYAISGLPVLLDAYRAEVLREAAEAEAYPGELAMLRGLLGTIQVVARHGSDMDEVRRLLAEHASDEQAAYAEGAE